MLEEKTRVLIVDDNKSLCRVLSYILNQKGYATTIASDGLEAIKMAARALNAC
jgi:CheY-like chemotaxis protein